jgi:hypothetical protein
MDLTTTEVIEIGKIVTIFGGIFAIFSAVLIILRWFKADTADMIRIFADATKAQLAGMDKTINEIREDTKNFHARLLEIEKNKKG